MTVRSGIAFYSEPWLPLGVRQRSVVLKLFVVANWGNEMSDSPSVERNLKAEAKAAKAYAKASRPWYKKKRFIFLGFIALGLAVSVSTSGDVEPGVLVGPTTPGTTQESAAAGQEQASSNMTPGQRNALRAAENYLNLMPFSRQGLINQLSSDAGDGYSVEDATFAADNVGADWKEQAARAAKRYLETMPFSRDGLIEQLSSDAGDGYTLEEATYGVDQAGL